MDAQSLKKISKQLSYVLRHRPDSVGLELGEGGWVRVDDLIAAFASYGKSLSASVLEQVVAENDKQRFEFSEDGLRIRARQGHSAEVDLGYDPATPPDVLYHGTATRHLDSILQQGLVKGRRHHVHMSTDKETMIQVGMRHGKPVLLSIDARRMVANGFEFYVTGNGVWLTDHVPCEYLRRV
ncbi:RNA 2'-phosphotransferase [Posidoniimonas corsicana]|uniref:Probable RNA 2'-phosphotransferase n=1 Tax=Posidoniimonas corsicana TaxID=1938618 RepID=A0A5C5VDG2_9BACT|nr:RNA 2'-phosphotransferase [Posidoniimonas corsicana]TWT35987.1 RNA 2'-phosphotransferase [Posidoniimonas corsicana]